MCILVGRMLLFAVGASAQGIPEGATANVDDGLNLPAISEPELRDRISLLYRQAAAILDAEAQADSETQERLLEGAMAELTELAGMDGVTEDVRFREVYRTIVTEFESYYGVSGTLEMPAGGMNEVHEEMFAALNAGPLLEAVALPALRPMETTIPMEINRLVEQSITYLLKHPEKTIDLWRPRSDTYFPMIEQILREEGVPDEMKYLAMIESGLNPRARSWAAANGMWQFISATGRAYGLHTTKWVDERLDPEKATRAAARHLKDLYALFGGDWHLAMAGYNCSPGRIKRAIARAERELGRRATFWDIYQYIPRETRNYVPMFIATALVISNPDAFTLRPVERGARYEYEIVAVQHTLDLALAARMAGTDSETIRALNPELRGKSTPPTKSSYPLRVPLGGGSRFYGSYAEWAQNRPVTTNSSYAVRSGDTLLKIARAHGVTVETLRAENGLRGNTIHSGQTLVIPQEAFVSTTGVSLPTNAEPIRVSYGGGAGIHPVAISGMRGPAASTDGTIERLATHTRAVASQAQARTPSASNGAGASSASASSDRIRYKVRRGDSLGKIAARHGVSVSDLRSWNNLRSTRIMAGQRLTIYKKTAVTASTGSSGSKSATYRVRKGDSLYSIARRHGVTITQLRRWNSLGSSTVIRPGQRLKVRA